ncbi:DUF6192 family protein [Spirillospora sp. NPDC029432]|uniref:DUF6192 family protein n=1 Tax=Spirillospora sp. NPDC029432 TaxID=3154599 RepID=UPI0034567735
MSGSAAEMVGKVTADRYRELVEQARRLVDEATRAQFRIGDIALEIAPMQRHGGAHPGAGEESYEVTAVLGAFAQDVGLAASTVRDYRWVSARWPEPRRAAGVSHRVHSILAAISDERARWERITRPPVLERTGERRWTTDAASRVLGWQVQRPESAGEKVRAIHDLARDEEVAAAVATDLLRRPAVARQAMADDTARHLVNRAQTEQAQRAAGPARKAVGPALERIQHSLGFVDLVGACAAFVASTGRIVPGLRGQSFTEEERAVVHRNLARLRGAADWVEAAVDTGNTSLDDGLAALLRDQ